MSKNIGKADANASGQLLCDSNNNIGTTLLEASWKWGVVKEWWSVLI